MLQSLFKEFCDALTRTGTFVQSSDPTKMSEIYSMMRILAAFQVMTYRLGFHQADKLCKKLGRFYRISFSALFVTFKTCSD